MSSTGTTERVALGLRIVGELVDVYAGDERSGGEGRPGDSWTPGTVRLNDGQQPVYVDYGSPEEAVEAVKAACAAAGVEVRPGVVIELAVAARASGSRVYFRGAGGRQNRRSLI